MSTEFDWFWMCQASLVQDFGETGAYPKNKAAKTSPVQCSLHHSVFRICEASAAQEVTAHPGEINGLLTKLSEEPSFPKVENNRNLFVDTKEQSSNQTTGNWGVFTNLCESTIFWQMFFFPFFGGNTLMLIETFGDNYVYNCICKPSLEEEEDCYLD